MTPTATTSFARAEEGSGELAAELLERLAVLRRAVHVVAPIPWPAESLSGAQADLLRTLRREPGISVQAAAERLRLRANTVSTLVGQLSARGLVRRDVDDADRRIAHLTLTDDALARLTAWRDERADAVAAALAQLDDDDVAALAAAIEPLQRLSETLAARG